MDDNANKTTQNEGEDEGEQVIGEVETVGADCVKEDIPNENQGEEDADNDEGEEGDEEVFPECADQDDENEQRAGFNIEELLKQKIKFKDDAEAFIFSRGPKYSDDKWPVNCHVCRLGNLLTIDHIKNHVKCRRHTTKLKRKWVNYEQYHLPFFQTSDKVAGLDKPIKIYPGEIIEELTEEYEDRVVKQGQFEVKKPSENILKELRNEPMHEYNKKLPLIGLCYMYKMKSRNVISYFCTLCNIKIEAMEGFSHVVEQNHQYKYIVRHFPKIYDRVVQRLKKEQSIDLKECVRNIFRKLYRKIENGKGFREITFVDETDFYKNRKRYLLKTRFDDHYDENTILITEHEVDVLMRKCINRMDFIKPDQKTIGNSGMARMVEKGRHTKRIAQKMRHSDMDNNDEAAWNRYHYIIEGEVDDINQNYQKYDRIPKSHPLYFREERLFFNRAGKDQQKLRILRREWIPFWRRRLHQFYDNDIAERKLKIKRQLRLRTDVRTPSPEGSPRQRVRSCTIPSPPGYDGRYAEQQYARDSIIKTLPSEPLGVISVLRLLTALEDQLGSLGPKAVQLLSKAVLAEKSNQNPNDLMMNGEIYIFFVTAKEKLKGQIYADIVDINRISAVNRAISDTTTLLDLFEEYTRRTGKRPTLPSITTTSSTNQLNTITTTASMSTNQRVTPSKSYSSNNGLYSSDNNGCTTQFTSINSGGNYSGLGFNQNQSGSTSGTTSTSGGNGRSNFSTISTSSTQLPSGIKFGSKPTSSQYNSASANTSARKHGVWLSSTPSTSYQTGSGNSQGVGFFGRSTTNTTKMSGMNSNMF